MYRYICHTWMAGRYRNMMKHEVFLHLHGLQMPTFLRSTDLNAPATWFMDQTYDARNSAGKHVLIRPVLPTIP